jgi:WhiB family transcriptional regulator, redox-sensing transcriptional regulator
VLQGFGRLYFGVVPAVSILMGRGNPGGRMLREWQEQAACRGRAPADFVRGPKADYGDTRDLCELCPVRRDCLETALADDSLSGLWGGTTDIERKMIRGRRVA